MCVHKVVCAGIGLRKGQTFRDRDVKSNEKKEIKYRKKEKVWD